MKRVKYIQKAVIPAYAGVIPFLLIFFIAIMSDPRVCGGDPASFRLDADGKT